MRPRSLALDRGPRPLALLLGGLLLLLSTSAGAQILFGKNKVVYEDREWLVYEQDMVHVYFYPEEERIAAFTLEVGIETYREYAEYFDYEFDDPIPLILYGTHHDLKQTHVIPSMVSEGTAGFTEFAKGRVALRATGNRAELRHLIRHEMVHAFMLAKLAEVMTDRGIYDYSGPPLWFIEGLAESVANQEPDARARMMLRDAVLNDGLVPIPEMWRIWGTFLMYKEGESIVDFMRTEIDDRAPALLLEQWWRGRDFEDVLELELGMDMAELDRRWRTYLKRIYYPQVLRRRQPDEQAEAIDRESWFDTSPAVVGVDAEGTLSYVCLSARSGTISLYRVDVPERGRPRYTRLVEGGREAAFESLPLLRSRLTVHRGRWVAFVAKHGATDAIYVYDLERERIAEEHSFPGIVEISSPAFSPDGRFVVFSGLGEGGISDLYRVDRDQGELRRLTDDVHQDTHPHWHPSGERIVFASDRDDPRGGAHSLYTVDPEGRLQVESLVTSPANDTEPVWSSDGERLLFVSDRDGGPDLMLLEDGTVRRLSDVTGGVFSPDWIPAAADTVSQGGGPDATVENRGPGVLSTVFHQGRFVVYRFDAEALPTDPPSPALLATPGGTSVLAEEVASETTLPVPSEYEVDLGLDFVQSVVALDPDLPYGSGASLGFTDLLGNHQLYAHLSTATDDFDLEDLNVGLSYSNLSSRWNRHIGVFRVATRPRSFLSRPVYSEVRTGGFAGITYPFSKFRRIEATTVLRHLQRDDPIGLPGVAGNTWLWSGFLSLVHDNTLWTWQGPMRGTRWNLTAGQTFDLRGRGFDRQTLQIDYRRYHELRPRVVLATRGILRASFGSDSQFFYLGGPNDLRGYRWFEFLGDRIYLTNVELRFPLVDRLALRFPFGLFDFPAIRGNLFADFARVEGPIAGSQDLGSFGYSFSMTLVPPLALRMDVVRKHDFDSIAPWDVDFSLAFLF